MFEFLIGLIVGAVAGLLFYRANKHKSEAALAALRAEYERLKTRP